MQSLAGIRISCAAFIGTANARLCLELVALPFSGTEGPRLADEFYRRSDGPVSFDAWRARAGGTGSSRNCGSFAHCGAPTPRQSHTIYSPFRNTILGIWN